MYGEPILKSQYQELCGTRKVIAIDDIHKSQT